MRRPIILGGERRFKEGEGLRDFERTRNFGGDFWGGEKVQNGVMQDSALVQKGEEIAQAGQAAGAGGGDSIFGGFLRQPCAGLAQGERGQRGQGYFLPFIEAEEVQEMLKIGLIGAHRVGREAALGLEIANPLVAGV